MPHCLLFNANPRLNYPSRDPPLAGPTGYKMGESGTGAPVPLQWNNMRCDNRPVGAKTDDVLEPQNYYVIAQQEATVIDWNVTIGRNSLP